MKRILITGSSGYLGSHLTRRCREAGHEVVATARRVTPELEHALGLPVMALDVLDPQTATQEVKAEALIHCATANDVVSRDFAAGVNLSVHGTRHVLELAVRSGIRDVIFLSTLQVCGTELQGTIDEAAPPRCESPYALNHLLGEEVCRHYALRHGLNVVLMRPANVYGVPEVPTVNRSALVPMCFVKQALTEGCLTLHSSGLQQRNFVSTEEIGSACLHLLASFPAGATVIHAASSWQASIREIAAMVVAEHERRTSTVLPVKIHSSAPESGNSFTLSSRLEALRPSVEASRQRMAQVIAGLFDHFTKGED